MLFPRDTGTRHTLLVIVIVVGCGLMVDTVEARHNSSSSSASSSSVKCRRHTWRKRRGRHKMGWRLKKMQYAGHAREAQRAAPLPASGQIVTRALNGGRKGETISEMPDKSLLVRIPGYQGERFDVRLDGSTIVLRSLSRYRGRGHGYTRKLQLPTNAVADKVTATHLRGSGIEIRIPTVSKLPPQEESIMVGEQKASDKVTSKNNQARQTLADRLNRKWDDPEGVLLEEDYNIADGDYSDGGSLQIIDMENSVSYAKDENAVSGYIDVRGTWQSY